MSAALFHQDGSTFHFYSIGIVAANKKLDSREIEVVPTEKLTMVDGEITDDAAEVKSKGIDASGAAYKTVSDVRNSIKAEWVQFDTNRVTAPDVRRGEHVMIYRVADTDKFYWSTITNDLFLRKLETAIWAFSGTKDEKAKCDAEHCYFVEISTHKKHIHLHTSAVDGEPFTYDIQLNTREGFLVIKDDVGNVFSFDSKNKRLELVNQDGAHLDLNGQNVVITAPGTMAIEAKSLMLNIGGMITIKAPGGISVDTPLMKVTGVVKAANI